MALSKRVRYEVLRRDNHTCRYCGGTAPDVVLTVDHVVPVALGGGDGPENLVTACKDCNAGKSSSNPDAPLVADVAQDALRWSQAVAQAAEHIKREALALEEDVQSFYERWRMYSQYNLPYDFSGSVERWLKGGLPIELLLTDVDTTWSARHVHNSAKFAYCMGIAKRQYAEMHDRVQAALAATSTEG